MSATGESATDRASRRAIAAACVGNAVEWYDFAIYGALATVVGVVFFPANDLATALSAAFAVYGTALIVRPLGALAFGRLGDTRGRRTVLVAVILLMTGATAGVGLLPGYAAIGLLAPIAARAPSRHPRAGGRRRARRGRRVHHRECPELATRPGGVLADRDDGGRDRDGHGSCGWALLPVRRGRGMGWLVANRVPVRAAPRADRPLPSAPGGRDGAVRCPSDHVAACLINRLVSSGSVTRRRF